MTRRASSTPSYLSLQVAKGRLGKPGLTAESSGCPGDKGYREGSY